MVRLKWKRCLVQSTSVSRPRAQARARDSVESRRGRLAWTDGWARSRSRCVRPSRASMRATGSIRRASRAKSPCVSRQSHGSVRQDLTRLADGR
jgi:hypothetical protein